MVKDSCAAQDRALGAVVVDPLARVGRWGNWLPKVILVDDPQNQRHLSRLARRIGLYSNFQQTGIVAFTPS